MQKRESDGELDGAVLIFAAACRLEEFAGMCHVHQTSPESSFTQKRICSELLPEGRITLSEMKLIVTKQRQASGDDDRV